jgi:hypothetical protein
VSIDKGADVVEVFWFDVDVAGPVTEVQVEALGGVLSASDGIDATVQADDRGGSVMFSRSARDAVHAVVSAVDDVEKAGMTVTGVTEDLVDVDEIARRARVTAAAVRYWVSGERGAGGFPEPVVRRARASLYSWAAVSSWLARSGLGAADGAAAATAGACALINAALTVRAGLRELPEGTRPLIARLVA